MKMKKLLLMIILLAVMPAALMAQTAKVLWCEGKPTDLYFVCNNVSYTPGSSTWDGYTVTKVYTMPTSGTEPDWLELGDKITYLRFDYGFINFKPTSTARWFKNFTKLVGSIGFNNFDMTNVTDMSYMYEGCISMRGWTLGQNNLNITSNVTDMSGMFKGCKSLKSLYLDRYFDSSNVTSMESMFEGCDSLETLRFFSDRFKTSNVTNMKSLFSGCKSLKNISFGTNFNTSNVTSMESMFEDCDSLKSLDLSKFNTSNVTTMKRMFLFCDSLKTIEFGTNFNTSNVTDMSSMFEACIRLASLDLSSFNTSKVTNMSHMFASSAFDTLDFSTFANFDTSNVTNMEGMFDNCTLLKSLNVTSFNTSNVTTMKNMFYGCGKLTSLDITNFNTSNVTNMEGMFDNCGKLERIYWDVSKFKTSNVTTMKKMFDGCHDLLSLNLSGFNTSNVTNMESMFDGCMGLVSLNVTNFNTSKVTNMRRMFYSTGYLRMKTLDVSGLDTRNVTNMDEMFLSTGYVAGLKSLTFGENFAKKSTTSAKNMFKNARCRFIDFSQSTYSATDNAITAVNRTTNNDMFNQVAKTTVIYLPKNSPAPSGDTQNVVYTISGNDLGDLGRCDDYYSEDKVDIELPHAFYANKAQYYRTMSTKYGTVMLPFTFDSNDDIQCYSLRQEHTTTMYFLPISSTSANSVYLFEKKCSGNTAPFIMEDKTGNFRIFLNYVRDTENNPFVSYYENIPAQETVNSDVMHETTWKLSGYYINQKVNDYTNSYYIAGDKFYKADGELNMYPHRGTFTGEWYYPIDSNAPFLSIGILGVDGEEQQLTDIESAELFNTVNGISAIYDVQGRRLQQLQPGLNIVHMQDGRILKVNK